jgi:hypothetical protein
MTRALSLLALCVAAASAGGDDARTQPAETGRRVSAAGFRADVEIWAGGGPRVGRVVVTADGSVEFEHLDERTQRWAAGVIRRAYSTAPGWDRRTDPVRAVWGRLGPDTLETNTGSIRFSGHRPLAAR